MSCEQKSGSQRGIEGVGIPGCFARIMQASTAPEEQLQHCLELFRSTFNASPLFGARAPCCLVLAGEQSMKQHGMALTVALECGATAVGTLSFTNVSGDCARRCRGGA